MPCCPWKCVPCSYFQRCRYMEVPWVSWQMRSQLDSQKLLQRLLSHKPTAYLSIFDLFSTHKLTILSKECELDNFESHNSLKVSFTNIWGLCLNFVDCESSLDSNTPDILALCETNSNVSVDSGTFSVRGYLPLQVFKN